MTYQREPFRFIEIQEALYEETMDPLLANQAHTPLEECMLIKGYVISEFEDESAEIIELTDARDGTLRQSTELPLAS